MTKILGDLSVKFSSLEFVKYYFGLMYCGVFALIILFEFLRGNVDFWFGVGGIICCLFLVALFRFEKLRWIHKVLGVLLSVVLILSLVTSFGLVLDFTVKTILIVPIYYLSIALIYFVQNFCSRFFGFNKFFIRIMDVCFLLHMVTLFLNLVMAM